MNLIECVKMAAFSIKANKMRSLLTMLGIIIGISAVIIITTIGGSVKATMNNAFYSFGMNFFYGDFIEKEASDDYDIPLSREDYPTLKMYYDLIEKYPDQFDISYNNFYADGKVMNSKRNYQNVNVFGTSSGYFEMSSIKATQGRSISIRDVLEKKSVAMVSESFAKKYCGNSSIINQPISVAMSTGEEEIFYVIGVYKGGSNNDSSPDNEKTSVYVPFTCFKKPEDIYSSFTMVTWNVDKGLESAKANFTDFFDKLYADNQYWHVEVYEFSQEDLETINIALNILTIAFSIIAAISLLVGGIGVMNIMLVSITERTNEIGVRKALGAQNSSIRIQFVTESILICAIGSAIGIALGLGVSYLLGFIVRQILPTLDPEVAEIIDVTIKPSIVALLVSVFSSVAIGVIFGYYPANRAAKMNPIDALRHE